MFVMCIFNKFGDDVTFCSFASVIATVSDFFGICFTYGLYLIACLLSTSYSLYLHKPILKIINWRKNNQTHSAVHSRALNLFKNFLVESRTANNWRKRKKLLTIEHGWDRLLEIQVKRTEKRAYVSPNMNTDPKLSVTFSKIKKSIPLFTFAVLRCLTTWFINKFALFIATVRRCGSL